MIRVLNDSLIFHVNELENNSLNLDPVHYTLTCVIYLVDKLTRGVRNMVMRRSKCLKLAPVALIIP